MGNRLKNYIVSMKERAARPDKATKDELDEILVQIGFFQHERLIHLLVTLAFAVFAIFSMFFYLITEQIMVLVLFFSFLVLLIPYIKHYYLLENGTQELYKLYDEIKNK
ncbi:MAG: hypothetical protein ACI4EV_05495 [Lachnospiraceae bacterium]